MGIAGEHLVAQLEAVKRYHQCDAQLLAVGAVIAGVAALLPVAFSVRFVFYPFDGGRLVVRGLRRIAEVSFQLRDPTLRASSRLHNARISASFSVGLS